MVFYGVIKNLSCDLVALVHQNRQPQLFTSTISLHHFATVSFRTHLNCITSPFSWSSWWLFLKKSVVRKKVAGSSFRHFSLSYSWIFTREKAIYHEWSWLMIIMPKGLRLVRSILYTRTEINESYRFPWMHYEWFYVVNSITV